MNSNEKNNKQFFTIATLISPSRRWMLISAVLGSYLFFDLFIFNSSLKSSNECLISFGSYKGHEYTTSETIGKPKCLLESKWMRVQQHQVQLASMKNTIHDWLWIDYHDRINVLVEAPPSTKESLSLSKRNFMVLTQSKYALEGKQSLAIIGGIIEPKEQPIVAAAREVNEEVGVKCEQFHFLGRFRTDVNRGMGWVHSYLAVRCSHTSKSTTNNESDADTNDVVGVADMERQDVKHMSLLELKDATKKGEFREVQWSNTVALALLHEELTEK